MKAKITGNTIKKGGNNMDSRRIEQILKSPETIYVTYQNIPVWIDKLKDDNQVEIRDMNSNIRLEVSLDDLTEIGTSED
jgi:H-type small acid-soluble spore protein